MLFFVFQPQKDSLQLYTLIFKKKNKKQWSFILTKKGLLIHCDSCGLLEHIYVGISEARV